MAFSGKVVFCNWRLDGSLENATCRVPVGDLIALDLVTSLIGTLQVVGVWTHQEGWMGLVALDYGLVIHIQLVPHNLIGHGFNACLYFVIHRCVL